MNVAKVTRDADKISLTRRPIMRGRMIYTFVNVTVNYRFFVVERGAESKERSCLCCYGFVCLMLVMICFVWRGAKVHYLSRVLVAYVIIVMKVSTYAFSQVRLVVFLNQALFLISRSIDMEKGYFWKPRPEASLYRPTIANTVGLV